jgi:hypothetical protein
MAHISNNFGKSSNFFSCKRTTCNISEQQYDIEYKIGGNYPTINRNNFTKNTLVNMRSFVIIYSFSEITQIYNMPKHIFKNQLPPLPMDGG